MSDLISTKESKGGADDRLVARFRAGDVGAFDELVAVHIDRLFAIAFEMLRKREEAQEVAQEALIKLYCQISTSRAPALLRPWLYRVCMNLCIDRQRAKKRQPITLDFSQMQEMAGNSDPANMAVNLALRGAIRKALADLPIQQRTAFTLCHYAGLSVAEIAEALQCNPTTVRVHLSRATLRLREVFAKEAEGDEGL